jgi:hypothetical protein
MQIELARVVIDKQAKQRIAVKNKLGDFSFPLLSSAHFGIFSDKCLFRFRFGLLISFESTFSGLITTNRQSRESQ